MYLSFSQWYFFGGFLQGGQRLQSVKFCIFRTVSFPPPFHEASTAKKMVQLWQEMHQCWQMLTPVFLRQKPLKLFSFLNEKQGQEGSTHDKNDKIAWHQLLLKEFQNQNFTKFYCVFFYCNFCLLFKWILWVGLRVSLLDLHMECSQFFSCKLPEILIEIMRWWQVCCCKFRSILA